MLAGHASVALENARLYESLRREAENAKAWLEFADAVSEARSVEEIGDETVRDDRAPDGGRAGLALDRGRRTRRTSAASRRSATPTIRAPAAVPELRAGPGGGGARCRRPQDAVPARRRRVPRGSSREDAGDRRVQAAAIAPLHAGFGIRGWITVRAPEDGLGHFTDERLRLLEGLSYRASVALQKTVLLQSEQESAEVAGALLEFSRRLAGVGAPDELQRPDRRADRRDARLAAHLAVARAGPAGVVRDRGRLARRTARCRSSRSAASSSSAAPAARSSAASRSCSSPGTVDLVPVGEDPLAVAPVVLPSGRIGCIAAAAPEAFPERKLRLLAGIANQASLALHISS